MTKQISYKCVKCGNCCHAGLEISIREIDLKKWIDKGENDFIDKIQIDPKSISPDGLAGYHIEEKNALLALLKQFNDNEYQIKKKELKQFILENHDFLGNGIYPIPIYSFIEQLGRMPVLIPHDFDVVIEGIKRNIDYIIKFKKDGSCPFLTDNLCSIQEIKPLDCKQFPYDDKGAIKINNYFLKICNGIKTTFKRTENY